MRTCMTWVPSDSLGALQKSASFPLGTKPACVETELLQGKKSRWASPACAARPHVGVLIAVSKSIPRPQTVTEDSSSLSF